MAESQATRSPGAPIEWPMRACLGFMGRRSGRRLRIPVFFACALVSPGGFADNNTSFGIWANYQYLPGERASQNAWGQVGDEALILYTNGEASSSERLSYAAELRIGPGSFTDVANNSTSDQIALHQAWVGWQLDDEHALILGKSQVPFAWKTINFWPGDMLLAGFGDQMDVGVKFSGAGTLWSYQTAFYLADDWGSTSTDTVDDNGHWGSSTTYRKVQTLVGDLRYNLTDRQILGVSMQSGRLQDLSDAERDIDGDHAAVAIHYQVSWPSFFVKASAIAMRRELPQSLITATGVADQIENRRLAAEIGYTHGKWTTYLDISLAAPETDGADGRRIYAFAPGARYDYGPGWVYLEFLDQDGYIDRNGQVQQGDFDALYLSMDLYFE